MQSQLDFQRRLNKPGVLVQIDQEMQQQLCQLTKKEQLSFFGGHPKSLQKSELHLIFQVKFEKETQRVAPCDYNVCQKTDGVRYILIVTAMGECYFVSRNTKGAATRRPLFYKVNIPISPNFSGLSPKRQYKCIAQILDGQLIADRTPTQKLRFLIFDTLVHMGQDVRRQPFISRLQCAELFLNNCKFSLGWRGDPVVIDSEPVIEMFVKDFFDLDCPKDKQLEFLFETYIKCMNHKNDGVIFNKKWDAPYVSGKNDGYLKWKPPHLNTIDFLLVPNTKYEEEHQQENNQLIDLYLHEEDRSETGGSRAIFYQFMVVTRTVFDDIRQIREKLTQQRGEYIQGVIAQCNFIKTPPQFQPMYSKLYSAKKSVQQLRDLTMNPSYSQNQIKFLNRLKNATSTSSWNIVKLREDKNTANACSTAENIRVTINENITEKKLIEKANTYYRERLEMEKERENQIMRRRHQR